MRPLNVMPLKYAKMKCPSKDCLEVAIHLYITLSWFLGNIPQE